MTPMAAAVPLPSALSAQYSRRDALHSDCAADPSAPLVPSALQRMSPFVDDGGAAKRPLTQVMVLSGFLGSGKTTVILNLIQQISSQSKVAWLKNKYGEVDSRLAAESHIAVTEVLNGCICCTAVGRLGAAVEELPAAHRPDRILLETSGSSHPAPIAWDLCRLTAAGLPIALDAIICVIDALNFGGYEDKSRTARLQTPYTDLILVNKHELVGEAHLDRVLADLFELNPHTPKVRTRRGVADKELLLGIDSKLWRQQQGAAADEDAQRSAAHEDTGVRMLDLRAPSAAPFAWASWRALLESLLRDSFYRIKGVVQLAEAQPALVSAQVDQSATQAASTTTAAVELAADCSCSAHSHATAAAGSSSTAAVPSAGDSAAAAASVLRPHLLNYAFGHFDLTPLTTAAHAGPPRVSFMGDGDIAQYSARICQQLGLQPDQLRLIPLASLSASLAGSIRSEARAIPLPLPPPPPPPTPPSVPAPPLVLSDDRMRNSSDTALDPPPRSSPAPPMQLEDDPLSSSSSSSSSASTLAVPTGLGVPSRAVSASSEPPPVRFSIATLVLIYCVVIADAVALNIVNPFISEMCEVRFGVSPEAVGLASGALVGLFSLAEFLSSFGIGHLSDLYGRKKFMLLGLASGCLCTLVFGVARSFLLALFMRFLSGLTNANLALTKTVIADVPANEMSNEQRSLAFAYLGGCFQLSRAIASALAGMTYGINVGSYNNPYFLPCLIAAMLNFAVLSFSAYALPETLTKKKKPRSAPAPGHAQFAAVDHTGVVVGPSTLGALVAPTPTPVVVIELIEPSGERTRVNASGGSLGAENAHARVQSNSYERLADAGSGVSAPSPAATTETSPSPCGSIDRASLLSPHSRASPMAPSPVASPRAALSEHSTWREHLEHIWSSLVLGLRVVWADALVLKLIVLQCMHAFANGSFLLLLTLLGALALAEGGLGFDPGQIGVLYIIFGVVCIAFQFLVYKHLHRRWGSHRVYLCGTWLMGGSAALMPLAGFIRQAEQSAYSQAAGVPIDQLADSQSPYVLSWIYLSLTLVAMAVGFMVCLPVLGAMTSHAVQGSQYRGLTLGVAQSLQSGFRGIGATVMGALFSYIAHATGWPAVVFWMLTLLNLACFAVGYVFSPADLLRATGQSEAEQPEENHAGSTVPHTTTAVMAAAAAAVAVTMEEENRDRLAEPSQMSHDAEAELDRLETAVDVGLPDAEDADGDGALGDAVSMEQAVAALDSWMEPAAEKRALYAQLQPDDEFE